MRLYAGIGSRRAPAPTLSLCTSIARHLRVRGWVLRTGHAIGCDQAFEDGAGDRSEVFLPWKDYEFAAPLNGEVFRMPSAQALEMAVELHPAPERLSMPAIRLHARNCHILLGRCLNDPVAAVVCWTKDEERGGTAFGLRLARKHEIPVHNLWNPEVREEWERAICGHATASPVR